MWFDKQDLEKKKCWIDKNRYSPCVNDVDDDGIMMKKTKIGKNRYNYSVQISGISGASKNRESENDFDKVVNKFKNWSKPDCDTNISRFMNSLDPETQYSEADFKELCINAGMENNAIGHLWRSIDNGGYGNIIKRENNKYFLREELVQPFKKYFNYNEM